MWGCTLPCLLYLGSKECGSTVTLFPAHKGRGQQRLTVWGTTLSSLKEIFACPAMLVTREMAAVIKAQCLNEIKTELLATSL